MKLLSWVRAWHLVVPICALAMGQPQTYLVDEVSDGQWYAAELRLDLANRYSMGEDVTVAVIDSGVDASHPVLRGSVLPGADFTDSAYVSSGDGHIDREGHGTAMAALIAGHGKIRGVAPSAKILPVRIGEGGQRTNFAAGIQWAADHGATVINISGAAPLADPRELYAIQDALRRDIVVVAGVGNSPPAPSVQYPAKYSGVLAVGATNRKNAHPSFSASGSEVSLCAPGERISSARLDHGYAVATGTSDSTALVSGVVALLRSRFPTMSARSVIDRLTATAIDLGAVGRDQLYGFGLVDPVAALTATLPTQAPLPANPRTGPVAGPTQLSANGRSTVSAVAFSVLLLAILAVAGTMGVLVAVRQRRR